MTEAEMLSLRPGDLIRHKHSAEAVIVHGNVEGRVTAVRVFDASNPAEWDRVDGGGRVLTEVAPSDTARGRAVQA